MTSQEYWKLVTSNEEAIKEVGHGTCICCGKEHKANEYEYLLDNTAMCPSCRVDAIVPDHVDINEWTDIHNQMFGENI